MASDHRDGTALGTAGGDKDAEEVAESAASPHKRNDPKGLADVKVSACKVGYPVEIAGLVEQLAGLDTSRYAHAPTSSKS